MINYLTKISPFNANRIADLLLEPAHFCNHIWYIILFPPADAQETLIGEIAWRVTGVAFFFFPTLFSYAIGVVGIAIKWLYPLPRELISPVSNQLTEHTTEEKSESKNCRLTHSQVDLSPDLTLYIACFLSISEKMILMRSAKSFFNEMSKADFIWVQHLEELRLWGGSVKWLHAYAPDRGGYVFSPCSAISVDQGQSLRQIEIYRSLELPPTIDYIARLMPGGPLAFCKLPRLGDGFIAQLIGPVGVETISLQSLTAPLMYGKITFQHFLVFRLKTEEGAPTTHLVVSETSIKRYSKCFLSGSCRPLLQLDLNYDANRNYLLRLITGEKFEAIPPGLPDNPQLV
jgi:hypothetical protein